MDEPHSSQCGGDVGNMSTAMHHRHGSSVEFASACRCISRPRLLLNQQSISVRAKSDGGTISVAVESHNAGASATKMLEPDIIEFLFNKLLRLMFLHRQFWVLVQVPVGGNHFLACTRT